MKNPLLAVSFLAVSFMSSLYAQEQDMEHEHQGHDLSEHQHPITPGVHPTMGRARSPVVAHYRAPRVPGTSHLPCVDAWVW